MSEFHDSGYWAVILGGSSGLGLASAHKLARHGMNICIVHRSARSEMAAINQAFELLRQTGVKFLSFNVDALNNEKQAEVIRTLRDSMQAGERIRCLVHSIAKGNLKPMAPGQGQGLTEDDFSQTIHAMGTSLFGWTQRLLGEKLFADDARVIAFTSEGSGKAWKNYAAVSAAKSVLESITRSMALEFAAFGIRANCIQAGVTDTAALRLIPGNEELRGQSTVRNPFGRLTTPEDVANAVYLLARDEASWINGCIIPVNGGEHLQ